MKITGSDVFWWIVIGTWLVLCIIGVTVMYVRHN